MKSQILCKLPFFFSFFFMTRTYISLAVSKIILYFCDTILRWFNIFYYLDSCRWAGLSRIRSLECKGYQKLLNFSYLIHIIPIRYGIHKNI